MHNINIVLGPHVLTGKHAKSIKNGLVIFTNLSAQRSGFLVCSFCFTRWLESKHRFLNASRITEGEHGTCDVFFTVKNKPALTMDDLKKLELPMLTPVGKLYPRTAAPLLLITWRHFGRSVLKIFMATRLAFAVPNKRRTRCCRPKKHVIEVVVAYGRS